MGVDAAVVRADDRHELLLTGSDAAAAQDALVVVADHVRRGLVERIFRMEAVIFAVVLHTVVETQLLQLAVGGAHAGKALFLMRRENELQRRLAGGAHLVGVGLNFHALGNRIDTGGYKAARTGRFDHADAAGADLVHILQIAQRGDLHTGSVSRFKNGGALRHADGNAVHFYINHIHDSTLLS